MELRFKIISVIVGVILVSSIIKLIANKKLSERNSIPWIISAFSITVLLVNINMFNKIAHIIGVNYPPSLLFFVGIIAVLVIVLHLAMQISELTEKNKELAQHVAILKFELENIKKSTKVRKGSDN